MLGQLSVDVTRIHDSAPASRHDAHEARVGDTSQGNPSQVFLVRAARDALAKLGPSRRAALTEGFRRVGRELLASAMRVSVEPAWSRRTWPRRRYPQQCYQRTAKYVLEHSGIEGMQLVHGVASHAPHFVPFDHAWVRLPGEVVFDGVVQAFFTESSYQEVMATVALDTYSAAATQQLIAAHGHPGPWNARWVPTAAQLTAYEDTVRALQEARGAPSPSDELYKNR
jgi:hypothetical protein